MKTLEGFFLIKFPETPFLKELLFNFTTIYQAWNTVDMCIRSGCIRMNLNSKLDGFFKGPCCLCFGALLCLLSPLCGMLEGQLAKPVGNISVPTTVKKMSVAIFCDYGLLFNGIHSWQTTNPDQIHKTTSQKQRRKSMHSHFRISWDYDTVMVKGRITPVVKGDHVTNTVQKTKGDPYSWLAVNTG